MKRTALRLLSLGGKVRKAVTSVSSADLSLGPGGGGRTSPAAAGGVGSLCGAAVPEGRNRAAVRQRESTHRHVMSTAAPLLQQPPLS